MKNLLVVQFETKEKITSWDILPGEHDVSHFLGLCLADLKGATVNGFCCARLDGQDLTEALDNCRTIDIAELLAIPS